MWIGELRTGLPVDPLCDLPKVLWGNEAILTHCSMKPLLILGSDLIFARLQGRPYPQIGSKLLRRFLVIRKNFDRCTLWVLEMAAPILWTPGKMRPFCRKSH